MIYFCILINICSLFSFTFSSLFLFFWFCHSFCGRGTRITPHYKCISLCLYVHFLSVFLHWFSWWCVMFNMIQHRIRGEGLCHFCISAMCALKSHMHLFSLILWFMQWYGGFWIWNQRTVMQCFPYAPQGAYTHTSVCCNHMGTS